MIAGLPPATLPRAPGPVDSEPPNGRHDLAHENPAVARLIAVWSRFGPYGVSSILLVLGYLHYSPGAAYSLSAEHYRAWSFPAFRYSDLIWLYLRDQLDRRPLPYVDYPSSIRR